MRQESRAIFPSRHPPARNQQPTTLGFDDEASGRAEKEKGEQLARLIVRAPIDGTVTQVVPQPGVCYNTKATLMVIGPDSTGPDLVNATTEESAVYSFWLLAFMLATGDDHPSRLADIGQAPPTVLVDSGGKPFDLATLRGKVVLVSFVYTTCNGACPLTTQTLHRVEQGAQRHQALGNFGGFRLNHARSQT